MMRFILVCWLWVFSWAGANAQSPEQVLPSKATPAKLKEALESQRLVVVYLRSTLYHDEAAATRAWSNDRVRDWLKENAVAFEYEPGWSGSGTAKSVAQSHIKELSAQIPGVIAFRDGAIVDQDIPHTSPDALLAWLEAVSKGPPSEAYSRQRYQEVVGEYPRLAHLMLAQRLERLKLADAAGAEYEWLLEQVLQSPISPPTGRTDTAAGFDNWQWHQRLWMTGEWRARASAFAKRDAPSQARIAAIRDAHRAKAEADPNDDVAVTRWLESASIARDPEPVAAWFLKLQRDGSTRPLVNRHFAGVFDSLLAQDAWATAGGVIDRPLGRIAWAYVPLLAARMMTDGPKPDEKLVNQAQNNIALKAGLYYAALLAAGRDRDAQLVSETVFTECESPDCYRIMVTVALKAKQVRPVHREWASIADREITSDTKLGPKVEDALQSQTTK